MGGDERMSAALLDRLTHRAHILELRGTSYRFRQQLKRGEGSGPEPVSQEFNHLENSGATPKEINSIEAGTGTEKASPGPEPEPQREEEAEPKTDH